MQDQLASWWRSRLTQELRDRLLAVRDGPLPPELALEVWRRSGSVHAVDHLGDDAAAWEWRLTPAVIDFLHSPEANGGVIDAGGTPTDLPA